MTGTEQDNFGTFGKRVKAARTGRGLKLGDTARRIGISRTSLGAWENDSVHNPDSAKVIAFTKLTDISLDWLLVRDGNDPAFAAPVPTRRKRSAATPRPAANDGSAAPGMRIADIPEIAAPLTAHANGLDLMARAIWSIPDEVIELGFNGTPGAMAVKRVITRDGADFNVTRGDYVLIDTTRNRIDEPGVYLLSDPDGQCARRALVKTVNDVLRIVVLADDVNREPQTIAEGDATVLGRIMGIFKPV